MFKLKRLLQVTEARSRASQLVDSTPAGMHVQSYCLKSVLSPLCLKESKVWFKESTDTAVFSIRIRNPNKYPASFSTKSISPSPDCVQYTKLQALWCMLTL